MAFPVPDIPAQRARMEGAALAMRELDSGREVSYRQLDEQTGKAAAVLASLGVQAGDRVAILCRNRIDFFVFLFACARVAAILVPLDWRMPASESRLLVDDCDAGWLICGEEDRECARQVAGTKRRIIDLDDAGPQGYPALSSNVTPVAGTQRNAEDTWYLLYTSGTTGRPKAVIQTFGMAIANYVNISQGMGLRSSDTTLCFLPLFHSAGINLVTLPVLILGGRVLLTPGFDAARTLSLLEAGELDAFFAVPAAYQALSLEPGFDTAELSKTRSWGCGGAAMPDALLNEYASHGAVVLNGMGMTETGPTVFLMDPQRAAEKIGSVGRPQVLAEVRLVGPDGQDVAPGEAGELWFSGPGVTPGYYNNPEATAAAFADGGWLRSGDQARCDADGYYTIVGRMKDMYISGGENVYPAEVEHHLCEHPDILEAAVIGIPDSKWGEVGCAFLLPRPGHEIPPHEALQAYLRERVAPYKVPKAWQIVEDYPRTAAGKIQKHLLNPPN